MEFSLIFEAQLADPTPEREHQLIHDCIEQAVAAEQAGFDRIWAVEHHALLRYAHMSAPEIFLAAVAARTSRIRIGHGVVCMPFNYNWPTRVAERAAMLDIISHGRVDLGAGRGGSPQELSLCGVDRETSKAQVREALRIIGSVWQEETFEWHGDLLTIEAPEGFPRHTVVPRPVQRPHPPLFLACTHAETVTTAAEYGVGALAFGFGGPDNIKTQVDIYRVACSERSGAELVSTTINEHFAALCPTVVIEDGAEAAQLGARGQRFFGEAIFQWAQPGGPLPSEDTLGVDNIKYMRDKKAVVEAQFDRGELGDYVNDRALASAHYNVEHAYGTPQVAIDYVESLEDIGVDEIMCIVQLGTIPHGVCLETIANWGAHVIPHFRRRAA